MRKILLLISILFITINCYSQVIETRAYNFLKYIKISDSVISKNFCIPQVASFPLVKSVGQVVNYCPDGISDTICFWNGYTWVRWGMTGIVVGSDSVSSKNNRLIKSSNTWSYYKAANLTNSFAFGVNPTGQGFLNVLTNRSLNIGTNNTYQARFDSSGYLQNNYFKSFSTGYCSFNDTTNFFKGLRSNWIQPYTGYYITLSDSTKVNKGLSFGNYGKIHNLSNNQFAIKNRGNSSIVFYTTNQLRAKIDSIGNSIFYYSIGVNITAPQNKIHIDGGNSIAAYMQLTTGTGTGQTSTDGSFYGVRANGIMDLWQRESRGIEFRIGTRTKLRIDSVTNTRLNIYDLNGVLSNQIITTDAIQHNTFLGYNAGNATVAGNNTAVGYGAMQNNSTGYQNTFMGYAAGSSISDGWGNASFGYATISASQHASGNVVVGNGSMNGPTAGDFNTLVGYASGNIDGGTGSVGTYNVFLGYQAGSNASQVPGLTNSIAIGRGTYTTYSNSIILGNTSITGLGTGVYSPAARFHQDAGNTTNNYHKFTAGATTGQTANDGFNVGIGGDGVARLLQLENSSIKFYTNGLNLVLTVDSVQKTKIGDGGITNYFQIDADGTPTLQGNATVFKDLHFEINQLKTIGVVNKPDYNTTDLTLDFPQNDTTEQIGATKQINHDWKEASSLVPHLHIDQTTNATPIFRIDYKIYNRGTAEPASWTRLQSTTWEYTYTSGTFHNVLNFPSISMAGKTISCIIKIKLWRSDNVYTGDVKVTEFDCHYEIDAIGSKTISSK